MGLLGNAVISPAALRTVVIEDESGSTFTGVVVDDVVIFDATPADVKIGKTFASSEGVLEGTDTKTYRVRAGSEVILPGASYSVPLSEYTAYDYTAFQCMISAVNFDDLENSVSTSMIVFNDGLFNVNSIDKIAEITKNAETQSVDFNITNDTEDYFYIHYFTYREEAD